MEGAFSNVIATETKLWSVQTLHSTNLPFPCVVKKWMVSCNYSPALRGHLFFET